MPKEFARLQAQNLGKVGATQDLLRGIEKILSKPSKTDNIQHVARSAIRDIENEKNKRIVENSVSLGVVALNNGETKQAIRYFEDALRLDSECIGAYLGLIRSFDEQKKVATYLKKVKATPLTKIIECVKTHKDILGNPEHNNTLLERSIRFMQWPELALALIDIGADAKAKHVLFYAAIELKNVEVVRKLLDHGANAKETYYWKESTTSYFREENYSLLSQAITYGIDFEIIKALVEAGADVNYVSEKKGVFPGQHTKSFSMLNAAIRNNDYALAEYLLQHGANPNKGRTFSISYEVRECDHSLLMEYSNLSETIWNTKNKDMLLLLIKYGADINQVCRCDTYTVEDGKYSKKYTDTGKSYCTALSDAILFSNDSEYVQILLKAGANPHTVYRFHTPGWSEKLTGYACKNQYESILPVLGLTIQKGRMDVLEMLIKAGASFEDPVTYRYYEDRKLFSDQFPLRVMSFDANVITPIRTPLQKYGWKGSRAGLFRREHTCYFSW